MRIPPAMADETDSLTAESMVPAGLLHKSVQEPPEDPMYNRLSEKLRKATPPEVSCSLFCGGKRCKYETPSRTKPQDMALDGVYSHW